MTFAWRMIPRYHPQIGAGNVLSALGQPKGAFSLKTLSPETLKEGENLFCFSNGSAALKVVLQSLDLPAGAGVAVPIYTCATVFEAIASAGMRCVFIDIDPKTFGFDMECLRRRSKDVAAVVMIHTFGYAGDFGAVREIVGSIPIIEDCAHAMGSTDGGRQVGLQGVAGIFSFNFHKPVSAGGGGVLVVNAPELIPKIQQRVATLGSGRTTASFRSVLRRMLKSKAYRPPWYGLIMATGMLAVSRDHLAEQEPINIEPMGNLDRNLIRLGMQRMESRLSAQRRWAQELCDLSGGMEPTRRFVEAGEAWNGFLWPVLLPTPVQREESLAYFRRRGVDAFLLWQRCLRKAELYGYRRGQCARMEDALPRLLLIPCYAELTASQRKRISRALREWPHAAYRRG